MNKRTKTLVACRSAGFTLIEVMIAVVVVAILASIALPSYQKYTEQARRADAQAALLELAHHMERHYTAAGSYSGATLPFTTVPKDGGNTSYTLSLSEDDSGSNSYKLQAAPINAMNNDSCGTLTLDHLGRKGSNGTLSDCWKR